MTEDNQLTLPVPSGVEGSEARRLRPERICGAEAPVYTERSECVLLALSDASERSILIATRAYSRQELTRCKQTATTLSNRNKIRVAHGSSPSSLLPGRGVCKSRVSHESGMMAQGVSRPFDEIRWVSARLSAVLRTEETGPKERI